jgi:hypothetical protein
MSTPLPTPLDRAALERILQRAAELQAGEREIGDQLSPDDVLALGREVGIPARYLQQAMLEEQNRVPAAQVSGLLDTTIGPGEVSTARVIRGEADDLERMLVGWMEQNELLAVQRHFSGRIQWEPLGGMQVALRRSAAMLGSSSRPFMLAKAKRVSATIMGLEPGYTHVALSASLREQRGAYIGGGAAFVSLGVAATAVLAALNAFWGVLVVPMPFALGIGYGVTRRYRPVVERVQLGLERALDNLERGEMKASHAVPGGRPSLIELIGEEVRKALKP